jgi:hypothetical protein
MKPTPMPAPIPRTSERRQRATSPAISPVARPFTVELRTIVRISGGASGENQADAPSSSPGTAQTINPRLGLAHRRTVLPRPFTRVVRVVYAASVASSKQAVQKRLGTAPWRRVKVRHGLDYRHLRAEF